MIVWEWDSAHCGRPICGIVAHPDRAVARHLIGERMRKAGAISALAVEVERDDDWDTRRLTGAAMIAQAQDYRVSSVIRWRDVQGPLRR